VILPKGLNKNQRKKIRILDLTDLIATGDTQYTDIRNTDIRNTNICNKDLNGGSNDIYNGNNIDRRIDLILPCLSTIAYNATCNCNPDPNPNKSVSAQHLLEKYDRNIDGDNSDNKSNKKRKRHMVIEVADNDTIINVNDYNIETNNELFEVIILLRPSKYIINNKTKIFHKISPVLTRTFGCVATSTKIEELRINNILNSWIYNNKKHDIDKNTKIYFKANLFNPISAVFNLTKTSKNEKITERISESTELVENRYISPGFAVATLQHWAYHGRLKPVINEGAFEYFTNSS
jgi:hypothetical protein